MNTLFKKTTLKALLPALLLAQPGFASVRSSSVSRGRSGHAVVALKPLAASAVANAQLPTAVAAPVQTNPFAAFGPTCAKEEALHAEPVAQTLAFLAEQGLMSPKGERRASESGENFEGRKEFAAFPEGYHTMCKTPAPYVYLLWNRSVGSVCTGYGGSAGGKRGLNLAQCKAMYDACVGTINNAPENTAAPSISGNAIVGRLVSANTGSWTDADNDTLTYTYQWYRGQNGSDANPAPISGATTASYTLTASDVGKHLRVQVTASDGKGGSQAALSAYLGAAVSNSAPTNITLSGNSVNLTSGPNTVVGTLSSTDPDPGDSFVYSLVSGPGDDRNASFNIIGDSLRAKDPMAMQLGTHSVRIRTTDSAGASFEKIFSVEVVNDLAPKVTSIVPTGSPAANATSVAFIVTFSRPVTGVDATDFLLVASGTATGSIAAVTGNDATYEVRVDAISGIGTLRLDLKSSGTDIISSVGDPAGGYSGGTQHVVSQAPDAPGRVVATAGDQQVSIGFDVPASDGGSEITRYTATANPGGITGSCTGPASCTAIVTNLTNGKGYTFTVTATNAVGTSSASGASNSVTPKGNQTLSFSNPGAQNFGTSATLPATATSGLPVTFSSATTGVCTTNANGELTFVSAGDCTINADQAGDDLYHAASQVTQTFAVKAVLPGAPTSSTATAGDAQASVAFLAPVDTGGSSITGYTVTVSPADVVPVNGASSPIVVPGLTNGKAYTFTVTATNSAGTGAVSSVSNSTTPQASQTITFADPGAQNFGTTPTLTATTTAIATPDLTVTFSSATTGVCTITRNGALTFVGVGDCTIRADQDGDASHRAASPVSQTFAVTAVVPGAPSIGTATVTGIGQAAVAFTAPVFIGGATITDYTVIPNPAVAGGSFTGSSSPITVSGLSPKTNYTFTVTASNSAGSGTASTASNAVTTAATQAITFANPGAQRFGSTPRLQASVDSNLPLSFSSGSTNVCSVDADGTVTFVSVGDCTIHADQAGDGGHHAAPRVSQTFAVTAVVPGAPGIGAVTLTGSGQVSVAFTAPAFTGGAAISGYSVTPTPAVAGGPFTGSSSPITVTGLSPSTNYTFTVTASNSAGSGTASAASSGVTTAATQTITFANPGTQHFGSMPRLQASVDSNLPLSFSSGSTNVCSVDAGGTVSFVATGDCTIHLDQAGNSAYLQAPRVSQTFAVTAVAPDAPHIGTATVTGSGQVSVAFAAPAFEGGAPVNGYTVTSQPDGISATGSGSPITVSGLNPGTSYTFTVTASNSAGSSAPSAASNAVSTATTQTITFANPGAQTFGSTPTLQASVDSGLPLRFVSATPSVCAVASHGVLSFAGIGTCTVTVHQDGDASHQPASLAQSFSVSAVAPAAPVLDSVNVTGSGEVEVAFTPSAATGEVVTYVVTAQPGGLSASGSSSPITVRGLTDGVSYTFTVSASGQAGGSAPSAPSTPVVPQVLQALTFDDVGSQRFDQVPVLSARTDTGRTVSFSSSTPSVCTVTVDGRLSFVQAGTCTVVAEQAGDASHRPTSATRTFQVEPVPPGVPAIQTLTPSGSGQVWVAFTPPTFVGGASIDGYRVTATPEGTAAPVMRMMSLRAASPPGVVTATGSGSPILVQGLVDGANYVFTVAAYNRAGEGQPASAKDLVAAPNLSWIGDLQKMYGEADFELPAPQSNSPAAFTYTSSNPAVATINGRTVTLVGEGSTTLTATQAATSHYLTGSVAVTLVVSPRPDPTLDTQVSGGVQAQADASVRFAQVQSGNIRERLRQVRGGSNASNLNLALAYAGGVNGSGLSVPLGRGAEAALPPLPAGWGLWLAGTATFGKTGRRGQSAGGFDFNTGGITVGADRAVGENVLFGLAGSWGKQGTDFDGTPSKVDADQRALAVYGLWRLGEHLFVDGQLANGALDFELTRWSALANASAHGNRKGEQWFGSLTVGYEHRTTDGLSLTGYGRYDGHRARLDGYAENGLGAYDLVYGRQRVDNSALAVGLEGSLSFKGERLSWRPRWTLEYRGALDNRGDVAVNYQQRPRGSDYVLAMRSYNDDALALGAGVDLQWDSGWMLSLLLGHEQGRNAMRSNSIGLQMRYGQPALMTPRYGEAPGNNEALWRDPRDCRGPSQRCRQQPMR